MKKKGKIVRKKKIKQRTIVSIYMDLDHKKFLESMLKERERYSDARISFSGFVRNLLMEQFPITSQIKVKDPMQMEILDE